MLGTLCIVNAFLILLGCTVVAKAFYDTWSWYKDRHMTTGPQEGATDASVKGGRLNLAVPYYKTIPGDGAGEIKLGSKLKLNENLYSLVYVALFRQEYIDACEADDDAPGAAQGGDPFSENPLAKSTTLRK